MNFLLENISLFLSSIKNLMQRLKFVIVKISVFKDKI